MDSHVTAVLRHQTALHLELSEMVLEIDKIFTTFLLFMYVGDLLGFITTVTLVLHDKGHLTAGSIDVELVPIFVALVIVSTILAVIRTNFGVWLSEKVRLTAVINFFVLNDFIISPKSSFCRPMAFFLIFTN